MHKVRRTAIFILTFGILLATVMGLSSAMTPSWKVEKNTDHIRVLNANTTIASKVNNVPLEGSYETKETTTTVHLTPDVSINAIIREPLNAPNNHPACLFIHGAGTGMASQVYGDLASALASAGITTLVPDKRMDTYTNFHRDYQGMAKDYAKSLDVLRSWPGVDPNKTGLYAESEGTWISSIMTAENPNIAFSILTSAPIYPGRQQIPMAAASYMSQIHAPEDISSIIPKILSMRFNPLGLEYADFNALPYWNKLTVPVLLNYGTQDTSMPIEQGAQELIKRTSSAGNTNVTVRYYHANHQMRVGSQLPKNNLPLVTHYTHNLEAWIGSVCQGTQTSDWSTPMIAGAQPQQQFSVSQNPQPGLFTSLGELIAFFTASIILNILTALSVIILGIKRKVQSSKQLVKQSGFAPGIGFLLGVESISNLLIFSACLAYIALVASCTLKLIPLDSSQIHAWNVLKVTSLICLIVPALLIERYIDNIVKLHHRKENTFHENSQIQHEPGAFIEAHQQPIIAYGWGHWLTLILGIVASIACVVSLSFLGLYNL